MHGVAGQVSAGESDKGKHFMLSVKKQIMGHIQLCKT